MSLSTANTDSANWNELNNFMRDVKNDQGKRIIKDENGVRRVILDKDGLRTSPVGVDVTTAGEDVLTFNSAQNTLKVVQTGTASQTLTNASNVVAAGEQTFTINHNLGYKPAFDVYMTTPSTYIAGLLLMKLPELYVLPAGHALGGGTIFSQFRATVSTTALTITYFHRVSTDYSPSVPTFSIKYYLYRESAS